MPTVTLENDGVSRIDTTPGGETDMGKNAGRLLDVQAEPTDMNEAGGVAASSWSAMIGEKCRLLRFCCCCAEEMARHNEQVLSKILANGYDYFFLRSLERDRRCRGIYVEKSPSLLRLLFFRTTLTVQLSTTRIPWIHGPLLCDPLLKFMAHLVCHEF